MPCCCRLSTILSGFVPSYWCVIERGIYILSVDDTGHAMNLRAVWHLSHRYVQDSELEGTRDPHLAVHGSFSCMVRLVNLLFFIVFCIALNLFYDTAVPVAFGLRRAFSVVVPVGFWLALSCFYCCTNRCLACLVAWPCLKAFLILRSLWHSQAFSDFRTSALLA